MVPSRKSRPRGADRISYDEAALILGVTKTTIARWVREGHMPAWRTPQGYHKLWRHVVLQFREDFDRNK